MRPQRREIFKNILIVVLALSVVLLAIAAYSDSTLSGAERLRRVQQHISLMFRDQNYRLEYASEGLSAATAAKPILISVRNSFGRQSIRRDFAALDSAYEALGGLLGEALESADAQTQVKKADWQTALQQNSIYYAYSDALSTELLGSWLEVECALSVRTDRLLLCLKDEAVVLYCAAENGYLCASTAVDAARFSDLVEACRPDGSAFALELHDEAFSHLDDETLLSMNFSVSVPQVSAANPVDAALSTELAGLFSFNPYANNSYTTSDGTQVFEESTRSLGISPEGWLAVHNSGTQDARFLAESDSDKALVEYARALLEEICGDARADARLQLTGLTRSEGETTLSFDYFVSGIRVQTARPHAAELHFQGTMLREMTLLIRTYSLTGATQNLLPERQAAAIVSRGSRLQISYLDQGAEILSAGWNRE